MLGQIVLWLLTMAVGGAMVYFSGKIVEVIGRIAWADEHLGGTKQAVVLFWFLLLIVGGLITFGIVSPSNPTDSIPTGF